MRYIKNLLIEKVTLNVVDTTADEAIITKQELQVNEDVEEFVRKHIIKSLKDDNTYSAVFQSDLGRAAVLVRSVLKDVDNFLESSQELTELVFDAIKNTEDASGDVLFIQYIANERRCFAIMKLDYQVSHGHKIASEYVVDSDSTEFTVNLSPQESLLPKTSQGLKKCAFFAKGNDGKIDMIIIDKGDDDYFVNDFLEAVKIADNTDLTRRFKTTVEKWVQRNLSDQIGKANTVRTFTNEALLSQEVINTDDFSNVLFKDQEDIKASFDEAMADAGYCEGTKFEIDKTWVESKMKDKKVKTDTGVVLVGDYDFFKDAQKFIAKENGDGSVDIIIKNVRNVVER